MKIYTKTGDKGKTSLLSGERVPKSCIFMHCCGDVDELNAYIGFTVAHLEQQKDTSSSPWIQTFVCELKQIQNLLFCIGSHLAYSFKVPKKEEKEQREQREQKEQEKQKKWKLPKITEKHIQDLELSIDKMQKELEPLRNFILPGGGLAATQIHLCRALCRRVERTVVQSILEENQQKKGLPSEILMYLNRLSDYFFVAARFCNKQQAHEEIKWKVET